VKDMARPSKAEGDRLRASLRKNRVSIDDTHAGVEPIFLPENAPKDDKEYQSVWASAANWYNYYYSSKDYLPSIMKYAQKNLGYDKDQLAALKKHPDWSLSIPIGKLCVIAMRGLEPRDKDKEEIRSVLNGLLESSQLLEELEPDQDKPVVISIQQRTRHKVLNTVYQDWEDSVVDQWSEGNFKVDFEAYLLFKKHDLKSNAIEVFKDILKQDHDAILDAYNNACEQAVEAYSHIKRTDLKKMLATFEKAYADLDQFKSAAKATRIPKAKKPKASDKQIEKLAYKKEDIDSKLVSISPVLIPGQHRLYVYNVEEKKLTEFVSSSTKGFEVNGSTLKNIDTNLSRVTKLRKPEEIIPLIQKKTIKQIDKVWAGLTTKINIPTGRINKHCILLRVTND
jgi:hypothetical protein